MSNHERNLQPFLAKILPTSTLRAIMSERKRGGEGRGDNRGYYGIRFKGEVLYGYP